MKGLFLKDLALVKNQTLSLMVIPLIALFMLLEGQEFVFVIAYANMIFVLFGLTTLNYDAFDNGYAFLLTLPITRKLYVTEKYMFSLLSVMVGTIISFMLIILPHLVGKQQTLTVFNVYFIVGYTIGAFVFLAFMLPIELKYGPEKGRIAMIVVFLIVMVCVYLLAVGGPIDLTWILESLTTLEPIIMWGILGVMALIILFISYGISCKIMEKKEF